MFAFSIVIFIQNSIDDLWFMNIIYFILTAWKPEETGTFARKIIRKVLLYLYH